MKKIITKFPTSTTPCLSFSFAANISGGGLRIESFEVQEIHFPKNDGKKGKLEMGFILLKDRNLEKDIMDAAETRWWWESKRKFEIQTQLLDQDNQVLVTYVFQNAKISNIKFPSLAYRNNEISILKVEFDYNDMLIKPEKSE